MCGITWLVWRMRSDVQDFFHNYYHPSNAVLVVAGNVTQARVRELAEKWFGDIAAHTTPQVRIPAEPQQANPHQSRVDANVPNDALYMAFHMGGRCDESYYTCDLLSDVLSRGRSSRLYQRLLKDRRLFSDIDAYVTGNIDPGLFVVEGKPAEGISMETAEQAIWEELVNLAMFEVQDNADLINREADLYRNIQAEALRIQAQHIFRRENCSELFYLSRK